MFLAILTSYRSLADTISALGVSHVMRYINLRYLLTYLLTYHWQTSHTTLLRLTLNSRVRRFFQKKFQGFLLQYSILINSTNLMTMECALLIVKGARRITKCRPTNNKGDTVRQAIYRYYEDNTVWQCVPTW